MTVRQSKRQGKRQSRGKSEIAYETATLYGFSQTLVILAYSLSNVQPLPIYIP